MTTFSGVTTGPPATPHDILRFWDPERKVDMVDIWLICVGMCRDFKDDDSPEGFGDAPTHLF